MSERFASLQKTPGDIVYVLGGGACFCVSAVVDESPAPSRATLNAYILTRR